MRKCFRAEEDTQAYSNDADTGEFGEQDNALININGKSNHLGESALPNVNYNSRLLST